MTMRADHLRAFEAEHPDCVAILFRSYPAMQEAVIAVPKAKVAVYTEADVLADGRAITWAFFASGEVRAYVDERAPLVFGWQHGDELERHVNGELCVVVPFAQGPAFAMVSR